MALTCLRLFFLQVQWIVYSLAIHVVNLFSADPSSNNTPGEIHKLWKTSFKAFAPSLKLIIAEQTPIVNTFLPINTDFGQRPHIKAFSDSLTFCVNPCRHFSNKYRFWATTPY